MNRRYQFGAGLALAAFIGVGAACSASSTVNQSAFAPIAASPTAEAPIAAAPPVEQPTAPPTTAPPMAAPPAAAVPTATSEPVADQTSPELSELAGRIAALPLGDELGPMFPFSIHTGVKFDEPWTVAAEERGEKDPVVMGPVPEPGDDLDEWCVRGVYDGQPMPSHFARTEWTQRTEDGEFLTIWLWTSAFPLASEADNVRERRHARDEHCTGIPVVKRYPENALPARTTEASYHQTPEGLSTRFVDARNNDDGYLLLSIDAGKTITHIRISGIPDDQVTEMLPLMDVVATKLVTVLEIYVDARSG